MHKYIKIRGKNKYGWHVAMVHERYGYARTCFDFFIKQQIWRQFRHAKISSKHANIREVILINAIYFFYSVVLRASRITLMHYFDIRTNHYNITSQFHHQEQSSFRCAENKEG